MWRRVWALIIKEFFTLWNDKRSRAVIIVPPIIQLVIFGYAATFDVSHVATAIYNEDGGAAATALVARFASSPAFHIRYHIDAQRQIAGKIDSKAVSLVIHIGPTFSRDLLTGRPTTIQAIVDGRQSNTALIILGYVNQIIESFDQHWSLKTHQPLPPAQLVMRYWFNPNLQSLWFIIPGIVALLTMVVTIVVTALTIAREREVGTFEQLLVTPFSPIEILIGKSLPALAIGLSEGTFIILAAVLWFHVPLRGNVGLLYVGLLLYILAVIGVGLMVSSLARTQQQAMLGAFLFVVPAVILSGFATPIANMPQFIQAITLANPMRYFLVVVRGLFLEDLPANVVITQLWPMAIIAALTLSGASWLFRHRTT